MSLSDEQRQQLSHVQIEHDCFGGCTARLYPQLVPHPCFECVQCLQLFTAEDFCRHSHSNSEVDRVCHWGFDAANWRHYIWLPDHMVDDRRAQDMLYQFLQGDMRKRLPSTSLDAESEIALKRQMLSMALQQQALQSSLAASLNPAPAPITSLPNFTTLQTTLALQQAIQKLNGATGLNALVAAATALQQIPQPAPPPATSAFSSPLKKPMMDDAKLASALAAVSAAAMNAAAGKVNGFVDPNPLKNGLWAEMGANVAKGSMEMRKESVQMNPADKTLNNLLGQYIPPTDLAHVKDLINDAVTDRLRPYLEENEALKIEVHRLREELARSNGLNGLVLKHPDQVVATSATGASAFTSSIRV